MKFFTRAREFLFDMLSSDPVSPANQQVEGKAYWNSTNKALRIHDGSGFIDVGSGSGSGSGQKNYIPPEDSTSENANTIAQYTGSEVGYYFIATVGNQSGDYFESTADHYDGMRIRYSVVGNVWPPLVDGNFYYIVGSIANTSFQLSLTKGGAPVDLGAPPLGMHTGYFRADSPFTAGSAADGMEPEIETGSNVISQTKSMRLISRNLNTAASGYGYGAAQKWDVVLDQSDMNILNKVEFKYKTKNTTEDVPFVVRVYDTTNKVLIATDIHEVTAFDETDEGSGYFYCTWMPTHDEENYTVSIISVDTTANAEIVVDDFIVGSGLIARGPSVEEWELSPNAFTVTGLSVAGSTTYSTSISQQRRVGESLEVRGQIIFGTVTTAPTGILVISLPFNESTDLNKRASGTDIIGHGIFTDGNGTDYGFSVFWDNGSPEGRTYLYFYQTASGAVPATIASADRLYVSYTVPIAEWKGKGITPTLSAEVVHSNARMRYGLNSNVTIPTSSSTTTILWDLPIISSSDYDSATGKYTIPADGDYALNFRARLDTIANDIIPVITSNLGNVARGTAAHGSTRCQGDLSTIYSFNKGDTVWVEILNNTGGATSVQSVEGYSEFSIKRISDFTAGQAVSFGLAGPDKAGFVPSYAAGDYIPIVAGVTNVSATTGLSVNYMIIGKSLFISGPMNIDPTAISTITTWTMSLPLGVTIATANSVGGTCHSTANNVSGAVTYQSATLIKFTSYHPTSPSNQTVTSRCNVELINKKRGLKCAI